MEDCHAHLFVPNRLDRSKAGLRACLKCLLQQLSMCRLGKTGTALKDASISNVHGLRLRSFQLDPCLVPPLI